MSHSNTRASAPLSFLPCSLWKRQDSTQRQLVQIRKFMGRAPAEAFCRRRRQRSAVAAVSVSLSFPFQGKYMEISFDFKGDPNGGLINSCECALSFDLRDHHNKFPLSLSSLFHPLSSAPPTVLLEKVSRACSLQRKLGSNLGAIFLESLVDLWSLYFYIKLK